MRARAHLVDAPRPIFATAPLVALVPAPTWTRAAPPVPHPGGTPW